VRSCSVRRGCGQPDFRIAVDRTQAAFDAIGAGERAVEQRHAFDAPIANGERRVHEIDAVDGERLESWRETDPIDLPHQPVGRRAIDIGRRPVKSLLLERVDDRANARLTSGVRPQRRRCDAVHERHRQPFAPSQPWHQYATSSRAARSICASLGR